MFVSFLAVAELSPTRESPLGFCITKAKVSGCFMFSVDWTMAVNHSNVAPFLSIQKYIFGGA